MAEFVGLEALAFLFVEFATESAVEAAEIAVETAEIIEAEEGALASQLANELAQGGADAADALGDEADTLDQLECSAQVGACNFVSQNFTNDFNEVGDGVAGHPAEPTPEPEEEINEGDPSDRGVSPEEEAIKFEATDTATEFGERGSSWAQRFWGIAKYFILPLMMVALFLFHFVYKGICEATYLFRKCEQPKTAKGLDRPGTSPFEPSAKRDPETNGVTNPSHWQCADARCTLPACADAKWLRSIIQKFQWVFYIFFLTLGVYKIFFQADPIGGLLTSGIGILAVWLIIGPLGYFLVNSFCGLSDIGEMLSKL